MCKYCGKLYLAHTKVNNSTKRRGGKLSYVALRKHNSSTCSSKCAKEYGRKV